MLNQVLDPGIRLTSDGGAKRFEPEEARDRTLKIAPRTSAVQCQNVFGSVRKLFDREISRRPGNGCISI